MKDNLEFYDLEVKDFYENYDEFGNEVKNIRMVGGAGRVATVPLSLSESILLQQVILGIDEYDLIGKKLIAVYQDSIVKAIGYQGIYLPINDFPRTMSEAQLCQLLDCYEVERFNDKGGKITSYYVPADNLDKNKTL